MALRVIVVQAEKQAAQTLSRLFIDRGDEVWNAWDLGQALGLIEQNMPDLLMMDLHFPGFEWQSFLRNVIQRYPSLKIILTNKHPDLQRELWARQHGLHIILRQPFSRNWIKRALKSIGLDDSKISEDASAIELYGLPSVRLPVKMKITLPYLLLALVFALASAYIVSQLLFESTQSRFYSQLVETRLQASDWMVNLENQQLSSLRLMGNVQGVSDVILSEDSETLRNLMLPLAVSTGEETIDVLNRQGVSLLSMYLTDKANPGLYTFSKGIDFSAVPFVAKVLQGQIDANGDKFSGLDKGIFYVCGPIYDAEQTLIGVIMVGRSIESLANQMARDTLSDVTLYTKEGQPLASTLFDAMQNFPLAQSQVEHVFAIQDEASPTRKLILSERSFAELYGPWEARGGEDLGILGIALPETFLVSSTRSTQLEIFFLMAAGIFLVISVGLTLANIITRPLQRLVQASTQVARGDLEVKVRVDGSDEVAVLAHSFNQMVVGLQEGSIYRDLLGRSVSPEVREQLRQTFSSGDLRLEGQEAVATVIMSDIRGFTPLSERVEPSKVFEWLNEYFNRLVPIVTANNGVVNKFDGDAMLAFFGILPSLQPPQESAYSACRAALEMLEAINTLNEERMRRGDPALLTGIGIHTGLLVAGGLGSSDRLHYTIIGDTVNTTQRLESLTRDLFPASGIVVSQATYKALEDRNESFLLEPLGLRAVKGKAEKIMVYQLNPIRQVPELQVML